MPEPRMIKATSEILCPHCSKKILVSTRSFLPVIDWALKEEDLETAKENLKKGIKEIDFNDPKKKEEILLDIEQKGFIVSPDEINPILSQIKKDNTKEVDRDPISSSCERNKK